MTIERTSPPRAADEVDTLRGFLDYFRATLRRQAAGLTGEQLAVVLPPSTMTLGGMVKHLAFVENWWFRNVFLGFPPDGIWADVDWAADGDWDWHSAAEQTPEELDALLVAEIAASDATIDAALAGAGLETRAVRRSHGEEPTLRWILVHMIEEYARHCGHADLLRESIDGATDL